MKLAVALLAVTLAGLDAQDRLSRVPPAPQEQTGTASIEGAVVDALTHEPVKKAQVMLNGRISLTAVTDVSGHFAFRQLPAGQYMVQAQSDRYPIGRMGRDLARQTSVTVGADEQKRDVAVSLTPGASVRGRIVDEEGSPMAQCSVSSMQMTNTDNGKDLINTGGSAQSDDKGEYGLSNVPAGKYYLMARCPQAIPLPHAFIRRGTTTDVPTLTYTPLFYPGTAEPSAAARVELQPGVLLAGIDFQMTPAQGVTVRGRARPAPSDRNLQIFLRPKDPLRMRVQQQGARTNPSTGEFQINNVLPGSYELTATTSGGGEPYFAKIPVEVGGTAPDALEVVLSPGLQVSGTLAVEGDGKVNPLRVMLNPAENQPMFGPPPQAEVQSDGTFVLHAVVPGRWRIQVNGAGYVKSLALGNQEVSGNEVEITAGAAPLRIAMGTKFAQIEVTVSSPVPGGGPLMGILWGATSSVQQNFGFGPNGNTSVSVPPGRYHVCAMVEAQPFVVMQNRALRKAMESRCETVEVSEGGPQKVQVAAISSEELKRMADSLEE